MLARIQAERKFNAAIALQRTVNNTTGGPGGEGEEPEAAAAAAAPPPPSNRRALLRDGRHNMTRKHSILTIQANGNDTGGSIAVPKNVLSPANADDVDTLRRAAHYSKYAECAYHYIYMALSDLLPKGATRFVQDFDAVSPMPCFSLENCDVPYAQLYYSNFYIGITVTPYSILVDGKEKSVVITMRGTKLLEGE